MNINLVAIMFTVVYLLSVGLTFAQTSDGQTPSEEDVCAGQIGAAFGLCNAYCEAMDCDAVSPQASDTACNKVFDRFMNITGAAPPCESSCEDDCNAQHEQAVAVCETTWDIAFCNGNSLCEEIILEGLDNCLNEASDVHQACLAACQQ